MGEFFKFIGIMVVVNAIGFIPPFVAAGVFDCDIDEAILNWHIVMTMVIALLFSAFVLDPSWFNLMWID